MPPGKEKKKTQLVISFSFFPINIISKSIYILQHNFCFPLQDHKDKK